MLIAGVAPPDDAIGAGPVTEVTVPALVALIVTPIIVIIIT